MKFILGFILSFVFAATTHSQEKNYDELRIGLSQEFDTLHQSISTMLASHYVYYAVGRTLVILDANGKWIPVLAEKIPTLENGGAEKFVDNGKEKIRAKWNIIEKAKWADGTPVTCADFKLALDIANSPNISIATKDDYSLVETITWDPQTPKKCLFTYAESRWDYYQIGRFVPIPDHLERGIFEKFKSQKEGYDKNTLYIREPNRDGLYNGPYKVSELKNGSHIVLVPNPYFYGEAPKFKKIVIKIIPNTGTLEANILTGSIQVVGAIGFTIDHALDFQKRAEAQNLNYKFVYKPSSSYEYMALDMDEPILKDLKVRKALAYGMDRENLAKSIFDNKQPISHLPITTLDPWYPENLKDLTIYKYSRRQASKLLDEAGWKLNKEDGIRYKDGKKLSLKFITTAGNKSRETVQVYLQNQLKDIGVETVVKNEPARVYFGETLKKRLYDGLGMAAWIIFPERNPRAFFHSSMIPTEKNGWSGKNVTGWSNPKVDKLIDQIETEFDPKKRKSMVREILKEYTNDVPSIPLFYRTEVHVMPKGLKNLVPTGHLYVETNQIEKWSW